MAQWERKGDGIAPLRPDTEVVQNINEHRYPFIQVHTKPTQQQRLFYKHVCREFFLLFGSFTVSLVSASAKLICAMHCGKVS